MLELIHEEAKRYEAVSGVREGKHHMFSFRFSIVHCVGIRLLRVGQFVLRLVHPFREDLGCDSQRA